MTAETTAGWALGVAVFSLCVNIGNAGWKYYTDTRFRRRVTVRVVLAQLYDVNPKELEPIMEVRNHGPGTVTLELPLHGRRPWWNRLPYVSVPPKKVVKPLKLEAGEIHRRRLEQVDFAWPPKTPDMGYRDDWYNEYWAPRSDLRRVAQSIRQLPKWRGYYESQMKRKKASK